MEPVPEAVPQPEQSPSRCVAALRPLFLAAADRGVDIHALLKQLDVDPSILDVDNGLARIAAPLSTRLALALAKACRGEPLAVLAGRHVRFGALGMFDTILASATTVRDAASLGSRFFGLLDETCELVLAEEGRQGTLTLVARTEPVIAAPLAELAFVTIAQIVWTLLAHNNPCTEVRFAHGSTSHPRAYESYFKCPVRFGAERNEMVFPRAFLAAHVRNGVPAAHDELTRCAAAMIARRPAEVGFADRVRREARSALDAGDGSLTAIAGRLRTSSRTLQRRLQQHGTSYAEILDDARRDLATSHVSGGGMSVASIAERLGFADASTFARAFRRWTRMSPTDYRATRATAASAGAGANA
jgi:AraC-like DNA-binding protein